MKTIVDANTGEIVDVEDANEIAERKLTDAGAITEQTRDFIEQYLTIQEQWETFKYILEKAMRENGIKTWKTDDFTFTVKDESIQKRVDTERLKEDGLYEKYLKLVNVKGSLQVRKGK